MSIWDEQPKGYALQVYNIFSDRFSVVDRPGGEVRVVSADQVKDKITTESGVVWVRVDGD